MPQVIPHALQSLTVSVKLLRTVLQQAAACNEHYAHSDHVITHYICTKPFTKYIPSHTQQLEHQVKQNMWR
jgi:hypothetical protein